MAYSISVDEDLEKELTKFLPTNKNLNIQEVLLAYIRKSQEFVNYKNELEKLTQKLPPVD